MARPTALNEETTKRICRAIAAGATYKLAAQYGGISYPTFRAWMTNTEREDCVAFSEAVKTSEAEAAVDWLDVIDAASINQWQAAAWKLERRFPTMYGKTIQEVEPLDWRKEMMELNPDMDAEEVFEAFVEHFMESLEDATDGDREG